MIKNDKKWQKMIKNDKKWYLCRFCNACWGSWGCPAWTGVLVSWGLRDLLPLPFMLLLLGVTAAAEDIVKTDLKM